METLYYNVNVKWNSGRKGLMCSPELSKETANCIEVATPPDFPKGIPGMWSPEHLFTAAINSCLMTTFLAIAENSHLAFDNFSCKATGKLETVDGKLMMSEVLLQPSVCISSEKDREKAARVLQKSEAACLISNSVRSKITMKAFITVQQPAL